MLQKTLDLLYRHPKSNLNRFKRFGGYTSYRKMIRARKKMCNACVSLPAVRSYSDGLPLYFLTGKNYLFQTLFCIQSLSRVTSEKFSFVLVDDGTFDVQLIEQIHAQLPGATIYTQEEIQTNLERLMPQHLYPRLYKKRIVYPHLKKLTDIHSIGDNPWKLVLDSDMLFWHEPLEIIAWLNNPSKPLHMLDCVQSYGYPISLMERLCGNNVPGLLNVGIIGLRSDEINWADLDRWINLLEEQGGASYYLEQALTAMLIGNKQATVLDKNAYKVNPTVASNAILHHYVDLSKKIYYTEAWKKYAQ
jgi:hypothetical protein